MKTEQKDCLDHEHVPEQPKKPYTGPQLTVYGTVEKITGQGTGLLKDTVLSGSVIIL